MTDNYHPTTDENSLLFSLANLDTLPRSETASYTSVNSPTTSSVAANASGNGSSNFDIDFNEAILQVHKRSPLYIIGDRAQHRVGKIVFNYLRYTCLGI